MPIYRGDKQIVKIYRGDREIKNVYRGDRQVFSSGERERVFLFNQGGISIYKAKYVREEQNSTINLSFSATPNFDQFSRKYEIVYENIVNSIFYRQRLNVTCISKTYILLGGIRNVISIPETGKHKIVIDEGVLYLDDGRPIGLAIGNTLDTNEQQTITLRKNSFYEMKIYQDDVLVYHFVPAYFLASDVEHYGIAELVNQNATFHADLKGKPEYE